MASYKLSELAEEDLRLISARTIEEWGRLQAEKYVLLLHEAMTQIAILRILVKTGLKYFLRRRVSLRKNTSSIIGSLMWG